MLEVSGCEDTYHALLKDLFVYHFTLEFFVTGLESCYLEQLLDFRSFLAISSGICTRAIKVSQCYYVTILISTYASDCSIDSLLQIIALVNGSQL